MRRSFILVRFGHNVRKTRKRTGLSQEALAAKAKIHRNHMGAIERGEANVTLFNMERSAKALGVKVRDLIDF